MKFLRAGATAALALSASLSIAQRVPITGDDLPFSAEALAKGVASSRAQCDAIEGAVWADAGAHGAECLRFWTAGLGHGSGGPVVVYLPPDQLTFDFPAAGYTSLKPSAMAKIVTDMQARVNAPLIFLARPGTFGSSGAHKERRRTPEAHIVNAALDELKRRFKIGEYVMTGLSGGGHTVAALLGWRTDIVCAVAASAVSSPRARWRTMGQSTDLTGYADSYEPIEHLRKEVLNPLLRVFVLGDPRDSSVPWNTQLLLSNHLKGLGVNVEVLKGEGSDPQRHMLSESTRVVGAACARGASNAEILQLAARGLKG